MYLLHGVESEDRPSRVRLSSARFLPACGRRRRLWTCRAPPVRVREELWTSHPLSVLGSDVEHQHTPMCPPKSVTTHR